MNAPAPAYTSGAFESPATFASPAIAYSLDMDDRMGRRSIGFSGAGTLVVDGAGDLHVVGRRHHYLVAWSIGAVAALATIALFAVIAWNASAVDQGKLVRGAPWLGLLAFALGGGLASIGTRFRAVERRTIPRGAIRQVKVFHPKIRIFAEGGDVELHLADRAAHEALLRTLAAFGVMVR